MNDLSSDPNATAALTSLIGPDERLLWAGRPDADAYVQRLRGEHWSSLVFVAISLVVLLAGTFAFGGPWWERLAFVCIAGVLLSFGVFAARGAFARRRGAHRVVYGVTDHDALMVDGDGTVRRYSPMQWTELSVRDVGLGHGDIVLCRDPRPRVANEDEPPAEDGFFAIRDAAAVYALLVSIKRARIDEMLR